MTKTLLFSALTFLILPSLTYADFRERVDVFSAGDEAATLVYDTNLLWLDTYFTAEMSYDQVKSDLTLNGLLDGSWRIATLEEVDKLFTAYGFTPDYCNVNGAIHCSTTGESNTAAARMLNDINEHYTDTSVSAMFNNPFLPDGQVGEAFADFAESPTESVDARTHISVSSTSTEPNRGVFLVKNPYEEHEDIPFLPLWAYPVLATLLCRAASRNAS